MIKWVHHSQSAVSRVAYVNLILSTHSALHFGLQDIGKTPKNKKSTAPEPTFMLQIVRNIPIRPRFKVR